MGQHSYATLGAQIRVVSADNVTGLLCAQQPSVGAQPAATRPVRTVQQPVVASRVSAGKTANAARGKKAKSKKPVEVQAAPEPVVPPPPPTPEQSPAVAPQVTYRGGMLTIVSQNATLGDILTAVRKLTGAAIEAPSTTLSERIATSLGPAPPKDVLASLFNGSRFNYIILGSMQRPGGIDRIILTARQNGGTPTPGGRCSGSAFRRTSAACG